MSPGGAAGAAARLAAVQARIEEIGEALSAGGIPEPEEDTLRQERMALEREVIKLRQRLQPDGGRQEKRLTAFHMQYKFGEGRAYDPSRPEPLDEVSARAIAPLLARVADKERMIIDDLARVIRGGPSEERDRRSALLDEWERLVDECEQILSGLRGG